MNKIESTLDSREVAKMIGKEHKAVMRDIRRYTGQLNECNLAPVEFFKENTYYDGKGEMRPCYLITRKGCEFIAHKLTGTRGTEFTARYINRFHEMEEQLAGQKIESLEQQIQQVQQSQTEQKLMAEALLEAKKIIKDKDNEIKRLQKFQRRDIYRVRTKQDYRDKIIRLINTENNEEKLEIVCRFTSRYLE